MSFSPTKLNSSSTRASPFQQRPESPSSPSSTPRYHPATPSRLQNSSIANADGTWSPSAQNLRSVPTRDAPPSPVRTAYHPEGPSPRKASSNATVRAPSFSGPLPSGSGGTARRPSASTTVPPPASTMPSPMMNGGAGLGNQSYNTDALGKLPAAQVREMREAFQILDRNSDGLVDREDVADMLNQLGMDSGASSTAPFFAAQKQHPLPMAAFLSSLSGSLAQMSPPSELLAALSAFDDDDSGQIDIGDLTEALLHTAPDSGTQMSRAEVARVMQDFSGKRAFSKHSTTSSLSKGDVFKYREWVSSLQAVEGEKAQAA